MAVSVNNFLVSAEFFVIIALTMKLGVNAQEWGKE